MAEASQTFKIAKHISTLDETDLISFVNDTIAFLKGERIPFLTKYNQPFGGSSRLVVPVRDFVCDLMQLALRRTSAVSSLD